MWASRFLARSPAAVGLVIRFLFIGSRLCSTLLSDPASRRRPCSLLSLHLHQVVKRTSTSKLSIMLGTQEKGRSLGSGLGSTKTQRKLSPAKMIVKPLVASHRFPNFFTLPGRAVPICRGNRRSNRAQRNKATFVRRCRLLFQDDFPIKLRHARVVGRVILDLVALGFAVPGPFLFFSCRFCDAQLVEIVLHFVRDNLFTKIERVLLIFHIHFFAACEDLVTPMLLVPLGERRSHVHLLDDIAPAHARVVGAETDLTFLRGIRNDALLGAPEVVIEQILEPHPSDKQEIPPVLPPLHHVVRS